MDLYSQLGPHGVSLREVAQSAGMTHALVARYFGAKQGLVSAGEGRLAAEVRTVTDTIGFSSADACIELLRPPRGRVRPRYPVLDGLLSLVRQLPADARPEALADPRLAATAGASLVVGSAVSETTT